MAISSKLTTKYQRRAISLPCRTHPTAAKIEEELNKVNTGGASLPSLTSPTAKTVINGLLILESLYKSMDDLLNSSITQKTLSRHQNKRFVDELQDSLISVLDVSDTARDIISQMREHDRDIQSSLRRRRGNSDIHCRITKYYSFRKTMRKETKRLMTTLKQTESKVPVILELDDQYVSKVIGLKTEVLFISLDVLNSLLLFLSVPMSKPKPTKWSLVPKLLHKGAVASESQTENINEFLTLDFELLSICSGFNSDTVETAQSSLKSLEVSIDAIGNGLACLFRGLIKATTSLLNIVSSQQ